jgi:hypothetical protein
MRVSVDSPLQMQFLSSSSSVGAGVLTGLFLFLIFGSGMLMAAAVASVKSASTTGGRAGAVAAGAWAGGRVDVAAGACAGDLEGGMIDLAAGACAGDLEGGRVDLAAGACAGDLEGGRIDLAAGVLASLLLLAGIFFFAFGLAVTLSDVLSHPGFVLLL